MIQKVRIQNFKSVLDLEMELGRVNVFIGENGSGKTSVLEGIAMGGVSARVSFELVGARGVRTTEVDLMKSAFPRADLQPVMHFSFSDQEHGEFEFEVEPMDDIGNDWRVQVRMSPLQGIKSVRGVDETLQTQAIAALVAEKLTQNKASDDSPISLNDDRFYEAVGSAIKKYVEENIASLDKHEFVRQNFSEHEIASFIIYAPENSFLRRFEDDTPIRPVGFRGEGLFRHLTELAKESPDTLAAISENLQLIDWFEGFSIPNDLQFTERRIAITDRFIKDTIARIDQRSANEGFLYLLFYFTLFLSKYTPAFFAIDNIDNALNPRLCAKLVQTLVKLAAENDKQAIFTTHNPAVLDGLDLEDDMQRLFVIYRNRDGETKARRVMPPKKVEGVEPVRLSEAFVRGYLGGLPQNF